jgi:hypothetical protein
MRILVLALLLLPSIAHADFCEDENLVLDTELSWDFASGFMHEFTLPTHRGGQIFPTKSLLQIANAGTPELFGVFTFPRAANQVGLEYNLYRLQIQIGEDTDPDRQLIDQDFTTSCTGPGAGLWPGGRLKLQPIKITSHSDGTPRGVEAVHLRFWGK